MWMKVEDSEFVSNHSNHLFGYTKQRKANLSLLLSNAGVLCPSFCIGTSRFSGINLLKPTGHVMHHQFNIQQLYALPTLYLCVLYLSENKQRLVPLTA